MQADTDQPPELDDETREWLESLDGSASFVVDGHAYEFALTIGLCRTVRRKVQFDLMTAPLDGSLAGLLAEPQRLGRVMAAVAGVELPEDDDEEHEFLDGLGAQQLHEGWEALRDAVLGFTRLTRGTPTAIAMLQATQAEAKLLDAQANAVRESVQEHATEAESLTRRQTKKKAAAAMAKAKSELTRGGSSSNSRASSGATPNR